MLAELVSLQIQLAVENDKLLFQAFPFLANIMILLEMLLQSIVVPVVMRLARVATVADEASLMLAAAMFVKLVVIIESFAAEAAERMSLKSSLVNSTRLIVAAAHVVA